jgi:hypothetical protein
MTAVVRDAGPPPRQRGRRSWLGPLLVLTAAAGGYMAGNLSPPVVRLAWEQWTAAGPPPALSSKQQASGERVADTLARVRAQEERWTQRRQDLQAEIDHKHRVLHLMKSQGRDAAGRQRLEAQEEQLRQDLADVVQLLAEITAVREGLEKLQDRAASGPAAQELDDLEEIVIRARRLLETRGPAGE